MKLLSFKAEGTVHVGAAVPEGIVDLTRALAVTHPEIGMAHSMLAIIETGIDIDAIGTPASASCVVTDRSPNILLRRRDNAADPRPPKILRWRSTIRRTSTRPI